VRLYYPVINKAPDTPVNAVQDFNDENDQYLEDWQQSAYAEFQAKIAGLLGGTLDTVIGAAIEAIRLPLQDANFPQMLAVKMARRWSEGGNAYGHSRLETVDLEDAAIWQSMCQALDGKTMTAESLKAAFAATIKAGQLVGGPEGKTTAAP